MVKWGEARQGSGRRWGTRRDKGRMAAPQRVVGGGRRIGGGGERPRQDGVRLGGAAIEDGADGVGVRRSSLGIGKGPYVEKNERGN